MSRRLIWRPEPPLTCASELGSLVNAPSEADAVSASGVVVHAPSAPQNTIVIVIVIAMLNL